MWRLRTGSSGGMGGRVSSLLLLSLALLVGCALPLRAAGQRLFFSLYMHSPTNSVVEVFNPSCNDVELSEFSVRIAPYSSSAAGAVWGTALQFTTTSMPLVNRSHASMCGPTGMVGCAVNHTGMALGDGRAAVGLFHNDVLIDVIGSTQGMCGDCPGVGVKNRGAPWFVSGVVEATRSHTMRRRSHVSEGSTDFFYPRGKYVGHPLSSEWDVTNAAPANTLPTGLGAFACTACTCPTTLFKATCGTLGNTTGLAAVAGQTTQVDCPLDCLTRLRIGSMPTVTGTGGVYARTLPLCLSAINATVLPVNCAANPTPTLVPTPGLNSLIPPCVWSGTSSLPQYSGGDSTLFPSSNRPNGRPHLSYKYLSNANFEIARLSTTLCASNCGGPAKGYCNQNTGQCLCNPPWSGSTCNTRTCPLGCSTPHGSCDATTGLCTCATGYTGEYCTKYTCLQLVGGCNTGMCNADTGACICEEPYFGRQCDLRRCPNDCSGGGTCNYNTGVCACNARRLGEDCSLRACVADCSAFGTCDYNTGRCRCVGSVGDSPTQCPFDNCPSANGLACSGHGACQYDTRQCVCHVGWRGIDCATEVPN